MVAHTISLIAIQSSVGLERLREGSRTPPPARSRTIETSSRGAMAEMRRMLAILRQDDEESRPAGAPPSGLSDLPALVREAGSGWEWRHASCRRRASSWSSPRDIDLCGYRIVQEALKHGVKHAPGAYGAGLRALAARRHHPRGERRRAAGRGLLGQTDRTTRPATGSWVCGSVWPSSVGRSRQGHAANGGFGVRGASAVRDHPFSALGVWPRRCREVTPGMITVLVVDDEVLLRSGLASLDPVRR